MPEPETSNRLYVGNIDYRMPIQELELLFTRFGVLEDVYLPSPASGDESKVNRGFAFVTFSTVESAIAAVAELNGTHESKFNRRLVIQHAKPRPDKE